MEKFDLSGCFVDYFTLVQDYELNGLLMNLIDVHRALNRQLGFDSSLFTIKDIYEVGCLDVEGIDFRDFDNYIFSRVILYGGTELLLGVPYYYTEKPVSLIFHPESDDPTEIKEFILKLIRKKIIDYIRYAENFSVFFLRRMCDLVSDLESLEASTSRDGLIKYSSLN